MMHSDLGKRGKFSNQTSQTVSWKVFNCSLWSYKVCAHTQSHYCTEHIAPGSVSQDTDFLLQRYSLNLFQKNMHTHTKKFQPLPASRESNVWNRFSVLK